MTAAISPAIQAFLQAITEGFTFAQVRIRSHPNGFELRHVADAALPEEQLQTVPVHELRHLAQFTADKKFRPLHSAPNLRRGWRTLPSDEAQLEMALDHLYPGGVADWFASRASDPPVTHFRAFTGRQTGMYRITQKLTDSQAALSIRACCSHRHCLKRRLWTVDGMKTDTEEEKSALPCLEPCAILLEFARRCMRMEQERTRAVELAPSDIETLLAAIGQASQHPPENVREGDFADPANPRRFERVRLLLEKTVSNSGTEPAGEPSDLGITE